MNNKKHHRGFVTIAILFVMLFFGVAYISLIWRGDIIRLESYISQGSGLMQLRNSLQKYAKANKDTFAQGKTVMQVIDQNAPTISELSKLGYFIDNGTEINPYGTTYLTVVRYDSQTGSISGMVYLNGSVRDSKGAIDPQRACGIAKAIGDTGLCTNPVNPALLGNRTTQTPNPTGALPAVIGALIYVSP